MEKNGFIDFSAISKAVPFKQVLDWLHIPYTETDKELKGEGFIVNKEKNLYFNPTGTDRNRPDAPGGDRGSVINFLANNQGISLREAAQRIKGQFLDKKPAPKREIPELTLEYHKYLEEQGISPEQAILYEVGYVGQRSIMAGKVCFRVRDIDNIPVGYAGVNPKTGEWFFPRGFKRPVYNLNRHAGDPAIRLYTSPIDAIKNDGCALLGQSMTEEQEGLLLRHADKIVLYHPHPENITNRLAKVCFVKIG